MNDVQLIQSREQEKFYERMQTKKTSKNEDKQAYQLKHLTPPVSQLKNTSTMLSREVIPSKLLYSKINSPAIKF